MNSFDTAEFAQSRYDAGQQNTTSSIYKNDSGDYAPATSSTLHARVAPQMSYNTQVPASQTLDFKNSEFKKMASLVSSAGNTSQAESDTYFHGYLKAAASSSRDGQQHHQANNPIQNNQFTVLNSESQSRSSMMNKELGRQESDLLTMNNLGSQRESHAQTQAHPLSEDEAQMAREEAIKYLAATQPFPGQGSHERRFSGMQDSLEPTSDVEHRRTTLTHDEIQTQAAAIFPQNHLANLSQIIIEDSQEDAYTRYTGHTQHSVSAHDQTVSIKGVGHINQQALQASYGGAQSSIGGRSQQQALNQSSEYPRESQMSYKPEEREQYHMQIRADSNPRQYSELNPMHARSAFVDHGTNEKGEIRVIIEDMQQLRMRNINSALQNGIKDLNNSSNSASSVQQIEEQKQQQIIQGNYQYNTNQYLDQIENNNLQHQQNIDNSVQERSPEIRGNHHKRRSSGAQSHRPSRERGDCPPIQMQKAYQQASDVMTHVISSSIETFKDNRLLNTNKNNNFAYNNNLVSENCRDSLDTYTYNTRFAQNQSEFVKSSHNFDNYQHNLLLSSSNQPVDRKIQPNNDNSASHPRVTSSSPNEQYKDDQGENGNGNKRFGYQFNQIWQSQKNISQSKDEASMSSHRHPLNTNSSKVEKQSFGPDTFRNQISGKQIREAQKDEEHARAADVLNQSLKVMKGNGNQDLPRPSNIQSSTNFEAVNYFGPKEYLAPLQMKQPQSSSVTRPSNIDSLNTQTVTSPMNGLVASRVSNVSFLEERNRELERKLNALESQLRTGAFVSNSNQNLDQDRVSTFAQKYEKENVRSRSNSQNRKVFSQERQLDSKLILPLQVEPQNTTEGSMSMLIDGLNTQNFADKLGMTQESKRTLEELNHFNKMQMISAINLDSQYTHSEQQMQQTLSNLPQPNPANVRSHHDHFSFRAPGGVPIGQIQSSTNTLQSFNQGKESTRPVGDLNRMLSQNSIELRRQYATVDDTQITNDRTNMNLNQAAQVRDFVERQKLGKSQERTEYGNNAKMPNITNVKHIAQGNVSRDRKYSNEQLQKIHENTENVLRKSREISQSSIRERLNSRSMERSFNQVEEIPPQSIHRRGQTAETERTGKTEPRGAISNLNGTQAVSQINSKYIKELRESRDSRPEYLQFNVGNENVYNDFILKNQCSTPADLETPFSVVDVTVSNRESQIIENKLGALNKEQQVSVLSSSNYDTLPEIQQAKSAFIEVQGQNQNLKSKLEQMQLKMCKLEEEKVRGTELNELKLQQFESKIKLLEIQNVRAEASQKQNRQSEQIDREERRAWELRQERMIKEAVSVAASEKINESNQNGQNYQNQTVVSDDKTEERIQRLEAEITNIHSHYQLQIKEMEQQAQTSSNECQAQANESHRRASQQSQNTRMSQAQSQSQHGYSEQTFDPKHGQFPQKGGSRGSYNLTEQQSKPNSKQNTKSNTLSKRQSSSKKENIVIISDSNSVVETAEAESQNQLSEVQMNEQSMTESFQEVIVESGHGPSDRDQERLIEGTLGGLTSVSPTQSQGISLYNFKETQRNVNEYGQVLTTNSGMMGCGSSKNLVGQQQKLQIHNRSSSHQQESSVSSQEIRVNIDHQIDADHISTSNPRYVTNPQTVLGVIDNNFLPQNHTGSLAYSNQTHSTIQNPNLTFGEKQRLFEHIQHLERVQQDHLSLISRLQTENQILNRFRYTEITSQIEKILPQCFENEIFMQWAKFIQVLNRCLKKCFTNGDIFKKGYLGNNQHQIWDTESLIKYIEKLVQNLQLIEKLVERYFQKNIADHRENEVKESHVKMIEMISESSLNLSQMPELYSQGNRDQQLQKEALEKVFTTLVSWQRTIQLHLDFQVCEFRHQIAVAQTVKKARADSSQKNLPQTENDLDEFWSDFSDNDFQIDKQQERDEIDILYNLQNWLNSNKDINFMQVFRPFGDFDHKQGKNTFLISCSNFQTALETAGYDFCEISLKYKTDFMCLIRAVSCTQQHSILNNDKQNTNCWEHTPRGMINYKQFLQDIVEKPFQWWSDKISSFLQEMQDEDDTCKVQDAMPPKRRALDAFQANLNKVQQFFPTAHGGNYDKFCQKIVMNRLADSQQSFTAIEESGKRCVTKGGLRKHILHIFRSSPVQRDQNGKINPSCVSYLNLSRLDCHILVKMIFSSNKQKIKQEQNPDARRQMKENHDRIDIYQLLDLTANSKQQHQQDKFQQRCNQEMVQVGKVEIEIRSQRASSQRSARHQNQN